jgi:hypothetical protein
MPKIQIDCDEWYPVYGLNEYGKEREISEADLVFVKQAFVDFDKAQDILKELY